MTNAIPVFFSKNMVADSQSFSPSARKPGAVVESWREKDYPFFVLEPAPLTPEELSVAHDPKYVQAVLSGRIHNGFGNSSPDVARALPYTSGAMYNAALHALLNGPHVACAPVSGFHHASYDSGGGFCTFEGLSITALLLLKVLPNGARVGIVDMDMHYGNGTADVIKTLKLQNKIEHYTFGAVAHDKKQARKSVEDMPRVIQEMVNHGCRIILYQAGADPHENDPLGGLLTSAELERRDRLVFEACKKHGVPCAWNLAGGYQEVKGATEFSDRIRPVLDIHDSTMRICAEVYGCPESSSNRLSTASGQR